MSLACREDCKGTEWYHSSLKYDKQGNKRKDLSGYYKCDGAGHIILEYWPEPETEIQDNKLLQDLIPNEIDFERINNLPTEKYNRPKTVAICPGRFLANLDNIKRYVQKKLGFTDKIKLWDNQKAGFEKVKDSKNVFLYGLTRSGKTILLEYLLLHIIDKIKKDNIPDLRIYIGQELPRMLKEMVMDKDHKFPNWKGFLIIDDLDKITPTPFIQSQLWYLFDRVDKGKLNIICTSNLKPRDCVEKLFQTDPVNSQTVRARIDEKFTVLKLQKEVERMFS